MMADMNDTVVIQNVPVGLIKGSGDTMRSVRFKYSDSDTGYAGVMLNIDWIENSRNIDYYDLYIPKDAELNISYKSGDDYTAKPVTAQEFADTFERTRNMYFDSPCRTNRLQQEAMFDLPGFNF